MSTQKQLGYHSLKTHHREVRDNYADTGGVPIVIHLMMNDYQRVWGDACYPVVD